MSSPVGMAADHLDDALHHKAADPPGQLEEEAAGIVVDGQAEHVVRHDPRARPTADVHLTPTGYKP